MDNVQEAQETQVIDARSTVSEEGTPDSIQVVSNTSCSYARYNNGV